jgi:outer membrane protein assembly factor BamD
VEEALYLMMISYEKLQLEPLRADTERVLRANFPRSALLSKGLGGNERPWWQFW